jgi:hypothetical protein
MEPAVVIAAGSAVASAVSAVAASVAARASHHALARAHRPFVWPELHIGSRGENGMFTIGVRLHNDGPGVAYEVSIALERHGEPEVHHEGRWPYRGRAMLMPYTTPPIRAMVSSEVLPPNETDTLPLATESIDGTWWVAVRWTDAAGDRWHFREPPNETLSAGPPRRLRRRRFELWRPRARW